MSALTLTPVTAGFFTAWTGGGSWKERKGVSQLITAGDAPAPPALVAAAGSNFLFQHREQILRILSPQPPL